MAKIPIWSAWRSRHDPPEGALWRGFKDARLASGHWWRFRIPAALLTVGFAVWSALLPKSATWEGRIALAIGGTVGGAVIVGVLAFALLVVTAPLRQRNDARGDLEASEEKAKELFGELESLEAERDEALARAADAEAAPEVYIERQHQWNLPQGMSSEEIAEVFKTVESRPVEPPSPEGPEAGADNQ